MSRPVTATFWHPYPVYQWEYKQAGDWADIDDGVSPYALYESGATTKTVNLLDDAVEGNEGKIRCAAYSPDGQVEYSDEVLITVGALEWELDLTPGDSKTVSDPTRYPDIYVSPTGSDDAPNDGTIGAPYATPQKAVDEAVAGDIIEYAAGTYSTSPNASGTSTTKFMNIVDKHGTPGAPIIHRAAAGATVVFDGGGNWDDGTTQVGYATTVHLESSTYVQLEGITISGGYDFGVRVYHGAQFCKLINCTVVDNGLHDGDAIPAPPSPCNWPGGVGLGTSAFAMYNTIDGCHFERNGCFPYTGGCADNHAFRHGHHVYLKGSGWLVQNCTIVEPYSGYGLKTDGWAASKDNHNGHQLAAWFTPSLEEGRYSHIVRNNTFYQHLHDAHAVQDEDLYAGGAIAINNNAEDVSGSEWLAPDAPDTKEQNGAALFANNITYKLGRTVTIDSVVTEGSFGMTSIREKNESSGYPAAYIGNSMSDKQFGGSLYDLARQHNVAAKESPVMYKDSAVSQDMDGLFGPTYKPLAGHPAIGQAEAMLSPSRDKDGVTRSGTTAGALEA